MVSEDGLECLGLLGRGLEKDGIQCVVDSFVECGVEWVQLGGIVRRAGDLRCYVNRNGAWAQIGLRWMEYIQISVGGGIHDNGRGAVDESVVIGGDWGCPFALFYSLGCAGRARGMWFRD